MAIRDYAWITLVQVKLQIFGSTGAVGSTTNDVILNRFIDGATDYVEKQLGGRRLKVSSTAADEVYDGGDGSMTRLQLNKYPCSTGNLTTVKQNTGDFETPSWTTVDAKNYTFYPKRGEIYMPSSFPSGTRNIQVNYKGGYDNTTGTTGGTGYANAQFPADLIDLTIDLVAGKWRKKDSAGVTSEKIGTAQVTWGSEDLSDWHREVLNSYKRINIA